MGIQDDFIDSADAELVTNNIGWSCKVVRGRNEEGNPVVAIRVILDNEDNLQEFLDVAFGNIEGRSPSSTRVPDKGVIA